MNCLVQSEKHFIDSDKEIIIVKKHNTVFKCITFLCFEGISSNKITKETAANTTQHFEYTCECNASNTGENLPCNETMQIYYSNKTVYLRDTDKYAIGSFECVLVENDVSEKTTTPPDIELNSKCFIS